MKLRFKILYFVIVLAIFIFGFQPHFSYNDYVAFEGRYSKLELKHTTEYTTWFSLFTPYSKEPKIYAKTDNGDIFIGDMTENEAEMILDEITDVYLTDEKDFDFFIGDSLWLCLIFIVFVIIPFAACLHNSKIQRLNKANEINRRIDEYYDKCISLKITSIETDEEKGNLLVVAKSFGYTTMEEAIKNYRIGEENKKTYEEIKKQERIAEKRKKELQIKQDIDKLRNEERQKYTAEKVFSEKTGKNKYISIINDKIKELQAEYKEIEKIDPYTPFMKHKKDNWGWIGGIADGIAGPGAGVMAAAEAHERNVNYNNAVDQYNTSLIQNGYDPTKVEKAKKDKLKRIENKINELKSYIDTTNKAIINEDVIESDFKKLKFTINGTVLEKTLHLLLDVKVDLTEPITLLGQKAIIDGSVLITVLDEKNQKVGEAYYNADQTYELKNAGFNNSIERTVVAIPSGERYFDKNEKYHFEVTPISIWTIEVYY